MPIGANIPLQLLGISYKKSLDKPQKVWHIMRAPRDAEANAKSTLTTEHSFFNFAECKSEGQTPRTKL
jgi:hypothetical protein